jgi:hypothetical protein
MNVYEINNTGPRIYWFAVAAMSLTIFTFVCWGVILFVSKSIDHALATSREGGRADQPKGILVCIALFKELPLAILTTFLKILELLAKSFCLGILFCLYYILYAVMCHDPMDNFSIPSA